MKKLFILLVLACTVSIVQAQVLRPLSITQIQALTVDTLEATHIVFSTFSGGAWNGSVIAGQYGGTGVANTGKTITLGGNFTHTGAHTLTLTTTNNTSVTLPTTGTLTTIVNGDSVLVGKTAYNATTWNDASGAASKDGVRDKFYAIDANYTSDSAKFVRLGGRSGGQTLAQKITFSFDSTLVYNQAFDATTWNNSTAIPTKNAVRDQLILKATAAAPVFTGRFTTTPVNTGNIVAGTGITVGMLTADMRYNGDSAIDISADPQIVDGVDGETIKIIGLSDTNTLTLDDGTGLQLAGAASFVIGLGDVIVLTYVASIDLWIEVSRSNN